MRRMGLAWWESRAADSRTSRASRPGIDVQMGTLGKALGSSGAYICGSAALRDYLINRARSFIFSTAPPPHCAAASCAAVELLESGREERSSGSCKKISQRWLLVCERRRKVRSFR